jgi:hypothetical protein
MPVVGGVSKAAGVRCIHLDGDHRCAIFGRPDRPQVCASLMPSVEMCGDGRTHAMQWIERLESQTAP